MQACVLLTLALSFFPGLSLNGSARAEEAPTTAEKDASQIQALLKELGSSDFQRREKAEEALRKLGRKIIPELTKAAQAASAAKDLEISNRIHKLLSAFHLKVGVILPLTGALSSWGINARRGIELAQQDLKAHGKATIEFIISDNQSSPEKTLRVAQELAMIQKVHILFGCVASSNARLASEIAHRQHLPFITPSASDPAVTKGKEHAFRTTTIDSYQGTAAAIFAIEHLKKKNAALVTLGTNNFSALVSAAFKKEFERLGGKVAGELKYHVYEKEYSTLIAKVKTLKPDLIFHTGYSSEAGAMLWQAKEAWAGIPKLGTDAWDDPAFRHRYRKPKLCFFTTAFAPDEPRPEVKAFNESHQKRYKSAPSAMAALFYDGVGVLNQIWETAGDSDNAKLIKALAKLEKFEGVTGSITLNGNRDRASGIAVVSVTEDGNKFEARIAK